MHRSTFQIPHSKFLSSFVLCTLFFVFPFSAFAAELYFGVGQADANGVHEVTLILKATTPLNALEGTINVSPNTDVGEISDAGSPVQFWIERPHLSPAKDKITFSGIIPGGFSGEAPLFRIYTADPPSLFVIDKSLTRMLENDGLGTADLVRVGAPKPLPEQFALIKNEADKNPPQPFEVKAALLPTEHGESPSLVWNARDDESGITRHEIAYAPAHVDPNSPSLVWQSVTPPLSLSATQTDQFIYVKAIDRAGNVRIAEVSPEITKRGLVTPHSAFFFAILSIALASFFGVVLFVVLNKKKFSTRK